MISCRARRRRSLATSSNGGRLLARSTPLYILVTKNVRTSSALKTALYTQQPRQQGSKESRQQRIVRRRRTLRLVGANGRSLERTEAIFIAVRGSVLDDSEKKGRGARPCRREWKERWTIDALLVEYNHAFAQYSLASVSTLYRLIQNEVPRSFSMRSCCCLELSAGATWNLMNTSFHFEKYVLTLLPSSSVTNREIPLTETTRETSPSSTAGRLGFKALGELVHKLVKRGVCRRFVEKNVIHVRLLILGVEDSDLNTSDSNDRPPIMMTEANLEGGESLSLLLKSEQLSVKGGC